jgi:glyoxylase I family protein
VPRVIDHLDLVVGSLERSLRFYRGLLGPLGWTEESEIVGERGERVVYLGIGDGSRDVIGLRERPPDADSEPYDRYALGMHHLAFAAASREQVDERAAWLREQGATLEDPPREYDYSPTYYAVFFYDPDGLKLEIVHR